MNTAKGTLKTISKTKGIILKEEPDRWYNIDRSIEQKVDIENLKKLLNKNIELELSDSGYYISISEIKADFKNADQVKQYKKVIVFANEDIKKIEDQMNIFAKNNKVVASTPVVINNIIHMFVYYEVVE